MWTLRVEMLAIPLFILGFFLLRRLGNVALVILLAILLALATWRVWIGLIDPTLGLALLPFFAVGMLVFGVGKKPWSWISLRPGGGPPHRRHRRNAVGSLTATLWRAALPYRDGLRRLHCRLACLCQSGSCRQVLRAPDCPVLRPDLLQLLSDQSADFVAFWHMPEALGKSCSCPFRKFSLPSRCF